MAPSSGDIYKTYFNDPTLSDLTIILSDQKVYVHRIVLCRRSKYFNKLILNGFKESSLKEIPLHGDDPVVMMGLFHYMYDRSYKHLNKDEDAEWQFLTKVYVAADKYEVEGLTRNVAQQMKTKLFHEFRIEAPEDFLAAVKIVFDGTTDQDKIGRALMTDLCVYSIRELKELPEFDVLQSECEGLNAKIFAHEKLSLMLEGTWLCADEEHKGAVPRCRYCGDPFAVSFLRKNRHQAVWECPSCDVRTEPVCTEDHIAATGERCKWLWTD